MARKRTRWILALAGAALAAVLSACGSGSDGGSHYNLRAEEVEVVRGRAAPRPPDGIAAPPPPGWASACPPTLPWDSPPVGGTGHNDLPTPGQPKRSYGYPAPTIPGVPGPKPGTW